jgi:hypothetical protein
VKSCPQQEREHENYECSVLSGLSDPASLHFQEVLFTACLAAENSWYGMTCIYVTENIDPEVLHSRISTDG